ncbi:MAG: lysophospholipid acyltransferase family protein [Candidatus Omnitrophica bacterium]|nr:lysophospholipid acyltransferase family protein [Candidatus Omnitrophota bacterium]
MRFKFRRYFLYYLARVAGALFYVIPLGIGSYIGRLFGRLVYRLLVRYRKIAINNLRIAFGREKAKREIEKIARQVFENLSVNTVELVNFPKINRSNIDKFVTIENIDIIDRALEGGKGAIVLTGHLGNWELLALTIRLKGYHGAVIGRKIYFAKYDKYLNYLRQVHDVNIIYRDESLKKILKVLKNNGIIGMLADQDVDSVEGVFVNFFGMPTYTPIGPAALAKASGASLIPAFIIRKNGRHTLMIENPIELIDTGDKETALVENTQRWSNVVESYIKRYPEQWVWIHRRWKTTPLRKYN